jgi:hypothetical protein
MKIKIKNAILTFLLVFSLSSYAQNNSVGIGTTTPDNSAILDLVSSNQGLLIPRNNTGGITSITSPSDGLILYNTDDKCYWFWNNSSWKRLCETDSLLTMINNLGDTIGFIYDSLSVHNTNISNLTTIVNNHSDSLQWIYDSLAVHNTNIFNNTTNISNLFDSVNVINSTINNLTTIINNHSDSLQWIYDSLAVHNTNITNNTTNIAINTTNIQNLSDSLGWVYDSLAVHNTNITNNTTNINNLYDSVDVINTHLGIVDSTLLNKWDIYGNLGTNPATNFLGTIDNQALVFRTNNTEKVRITNIGRVGIGTNNPTQLLDINSNALRLRNGATNNFVLTTDATGVGTWQDPSLNPILTTYITTTTAPLGNDWKLLGNAGTNAATNFLGTTDNVDLVFRRNGLRVGYLGETNLAFGTYSFRDNTTGTNNTTVGYQSLLSNLSGSYNSSYGYNSMGFNLSGFFNVAYGAQSLYQNTTGSFNTAIGYDANNAGNFNNTSAMGFGSSITADNQIRLGNASVSSIGGFTNWTNVSDGRFKVNVSENVVGMEFINLLRPVTYNLDMDAIASFYNTPDSLRLKEYEKAKASELQIGFIAQEIEKSATKLNFNFHGVDKPKNTNDHYGLRYVEFVPVIIKGMQELDKTIQFLLEKIEQLEKEISSLK